MKNSKKTNAVVRININSTAALGAELRQLADAVPGLKITSLAVEAIKAGLPLIRRKLVETGAWLDADD